MTLSKCYFSMEACESTIEYTNNAVLSIGYFYIYEFNLNRFVVIFHSPLFDVFKGGIEVFSKGC